MALTVRYATHDKARAACRPGEVPFFVQLDPRTGEHCYVVVPAEATLTELWELALTLAGRPPTPAELRVLSGRQTGVAE